jgi:hypothetical protein
MSEISRKIEELELEKVIFGSRRKRVRSETQTHNAIRHATALAQAISKATAGSRTAKAAQSDAGSKLAQLQALQKVLLPTLGKKGRGQYKADLKAPGKATSGNVQRSVQAKQNAQKTGRGSEPTARLRMNSGGVTFHLKHTFVSRMTTGSRDPNARRSGTASAHQRYLERTNAAERTDGAANGPSTTPVAGLGGDAGPGNEVSLAGGPLEVGNIGETRQERSEFWERVEHNERQGVERGGRVQCRLVIELPHELTGEQRLSILQAFARRFEERGLPHYGVIHAPDENNDDRNYHAHLAYYDRPSRKSGNGTWDFEDPATRQNKDRDARGAMWIRDLRQFYSEVANQHLEAAGVEKRYDPRSYKDGEVDKPPDQHLGSKLAAMERQGYASREGVHNGKVDADRHLLQVLERSQQSRYRVRQHLAPVRATLDLATGETNEKVIEEATELRQLVGNYLINERFLIGHARRKALLQAHKRLELARPYQTVKWAERELEKIDAAIPTRGFDTKQKSRRTGVHRRKAEAEAVLADIDQRYGPEWAKLEALDKKAEALRKETALLLSRLDTYKKALDFRLSGTEIQRDLAARISRQPQPDPAHRQTPTPPTKTAPFEPRQSQTRVQIRATLLGLTAALAREAAFQSTENVPSSQKQATATDFAAPDPQNSSPETELSPKKPADIENTPERLSENGNHTLPSAAKKKSPFSLPRRPQITLK